MHEAGRVLRGASDGFEDGAHALVLLPVCDVCRHLGGVGVCVEGAFPDDGVDGARLEGRVLGGRYADEQAESREHGGAEVARRSEHGGGPFLPGKLFA